MKIIIKKKIAAVLPTCPHCGRRGVEVGGWRSQIMHQLDWIQRALTGFGGIYTALSTQMLHASGMTSFWSPHIPADPLLLLLLLLLTLAHKPVYLRLSRVSPDCARHSAFLLSDRRRATLPPSPPILQSSHPLLPSSPLLLSSTLLSSRPRSCLL